jgi:hypothetical protein
MGFSTHDPHEWEESVDLDDCGDPEDDFCEDCNALRDSTGNRALLCSDCRDYLERHTGRFMVASNPLFHELAAIVGSDEAELAVRLYGDDARDYV